MRVIQLSTQQQLHCNWQSSSDWSYKNLILNQHHRYTSTRNLSQHIRMAFAVIQTSCSLFLLALFLIFIPTIHGRMRICIGNNFRNYTEITNSHERTLDAVKAQQHYLENKTFFPTFSNQSDTEIEAVKSLFRMIGQSKALQQFDRNSRVIAVLFNKTVVDACHWVSLACICDNWCCL